MTMLTTLSLTPGDLPYPGGAPSAVPARQTMFFVGGCPKSGTTWLQILLDSHPEISCIGEGHLTTHLLPLLTQVFDQHNELVQHKNSTVLHNLPGFPCLTDQQRDDLLAATVATLLLSPAKAAAARAVGEKTPDNHMYFPHLAALFPEARFINIVRDGRDCAVSAWFHNARLGPDEQSRDYATLHDFLMPFVEHWAVTVGDSVDWCEARPERALVVRYEDLVARPDAELRRLFRFLGVTTAEPVVRACRQAGAFETLSGGRSPGQEDRNSLFRRGLPGDSRNHLSAEDNIAFLAVGGTLLARLGYT